MFRDMDRDSPPREAILLLSLADSFFARAFPPRRPSNWAIRWVSIPALLLTAKHIAMGETGYR